MPNSFEYSVPCSDGTDPKCHGQVQVRISVPNLTSEQLQQISEGDGSARLELAQDQVDKSTLDKDDLEVLRSSGSILREVHAQGQTVCGACGSDI